MSGSLAEVQTIADQILEMLDVRLQAGQLVIHFSDGRAMKCETVKVHQPKREPLEATIADQILAVLGVRLKAGQLVIHYSEGRVMKCETNTVHHPRRPSPAPRNPLDRA